MEKERSLMIANPDMVEELYKSVDTAIKERALKDVTQKKVTITKVIYADANNFEIHSNVKEENRSYPVYIKVGASEIDNIKCDCEEYQTTYGACQHIIATMAEFVQNPSYIALFAAEREERKKQEIKINNKDNYRNFRQMIATFYQEVEQQETKAIKEKGKPGSIRIEPKIIFDKFSKELKVEFKIGNKQLYKLRNLPEFHEAMLQKANFRYGAKLEFVHQEEMFEPESRPLLEFILKYAEFIQYVNDNSKNNFYGGSSIPIDSIAITGSILDELFQILVGKVVMMQKDYQETELILLDNNPEILFELEYQDKEKGVYRLTPNKDVFEYCIWKGQKYQYFLQKNKLYRCRKEFMKGSLQLLECFRRNFTNEILFPKKDIPVFFSVVYPKVKKQINLEKINHQELEKYIPKELAVKVYLDFDNNNYLVAEVQFCYGDISFNPMSQKQTVSITRNIVQENEVANMFAGAGFLLDQKKERLVLANEEKMYHFLVNEMENYMQKFEILVTDRFKQKQVRQPKVGNIGVKVENNLLKIEMDYFNFEKEELQEILKKYRLKKKYYRLKDGSFLDLEQSEEINVLAEMTEGMNIADKDLESGKWQLPVYRSFYLEKLLEKIKNTPVEVNEEYREMVQSVGEKEKTNNIGVPKQMDTMLRYYQKVGFKWLKTLDHYGLGGILADDMGLGKTLQMITVLVSYIEETPSQIRKPSIVICPSSLSLNWSNEIQKFAPQIRTLVIHGSNQERKRQIRKGVYYDLIITSYDLLKRDVEYYEGIEFKYAIADEAQYIKNSNTQNAKAIKQVVAQTRYALTGTPIENSLSELWSIFDYMMPGYLFSYRKFKELYETPIIKNEDSYALSRLKMLIEPFVLRRVKKEVLTELPDKTITILNNEMAEEQAKLYMSYLAQSKREVMAEIESNGIEKSQIKILSLLTRLRQICCHPALFLRDYTGESSKLNQCMEIIKDGIQSGHKILLFSGYTSMFELLEKELKKEKIKYFKLTGQTKVGERIDLVDEFNENKEIKIFLISLKAGGTGLNLIGADMVIHYDPWWNLSAENQATDRTYRIGQKHNVQVYKLITKNSIEEKIYELQQRKAQLVDHMLGNTQPTFINKLSKEDIIELFS